MNGIDKVMAFSPSKAMEKKVMAIDSLIATIVQLQARLDWHNVLSMEISPVTNSASIHVNDHALLKAVAERLGTVITLNEGRTSDGESFKQHRIIVSGITLFSMEML